MARHDAAMLHFRQWFLRSRRTGFSSLRALLEEGGRHRQLIGAAASPLIWAALIPLTTALGALALGRWSLLFLLAYPLQVIRLSARRHAAGRNGFERGFFLVLGRWPELVGQIEYLASSVWHPSFDYKSRKREQ